MIKFRNFLKIGALSVKRQRLLMLICGASIAASTKAAPPPAPEGFKWKVQEAFTDEFDGDKLDSHKWHQNHPTWRGRPPAMFVTENSSVSGGLLRQTNGMLKEPVTIKNTTFTIGGAAVVSKAKAHFGYYECRLKGSQTPMSSTFWMSNKGRTYPGVGHVAQELDILETVGISTNIPKFVTHMNSNTHVWYRGHNGKDSLSAGNRAELPNGEASYENFNVYGGWWENANTAHFYLNDKHVGTVNFDTSLVPHPFPDPMQINMVTETYDWEPAPTPEHFSDLSKNTTLIDWVRGYELVTIVGEVPKWKIDAAYTELRDWQIGGGRTLNAKLLNQTISSVTLVDADGKEHRVKKTVMSDEDKDLLRILRSLEK